jgi:hypothetical protein
VTSRASVIAKPKRNQSGGDSPQERQAHPNPFLPSPQPLSPVVENKGLPNSEHGGGSLGVFALEDLGYYPEWIIRVLVVSRLLTGR